MHQTITHCIHCICTWARKLKTMKIYVQRNCFRNMKNSLCLLPWRQWERTAACARSLAYTLRPNGLEFLIAKGTMRMFCKIACVNMNIQCVHFTISFLFRCTSNWKGEKNGTPRMLCRNDWYFAYYFRFSRINSEWSCVRCPPRETLYSTEYFPALPRCVVRGLIRMVNTSSTLCQKCFSLPNRTLPKTTQVQSLQFNYRANQ